MDVRNEAIEGEQTALSGLLDALRPKLHRYCARMTGSLVDGEDVVQEAMIKAIEAYPSAAPIMNAEGWLFRIAHNAAIDFLRRRARAQESESGDEMSNIPDPLAASDQRIAAVAGLRTFMRLPVTQRSCVLLKGVLGYSIDEIVDVLEGTTVPGIKAACIAAGCASRLSPRNCTTLPCRICLNARALFAGYVERFNARDFDGVRDMLADEVRLELVAREHMNGKTEVGRYLGNYARTDDWRFAVGFVDGRPAVLAIRPDDPSGRPSYFVLLQWQDDRLIGIRDFRYARYASDGAEFALIGEAAPSGAGHTSKR